MTVPYQFAELKSFNWLTLTLTLTSPHLTNANTGFAQLDFLVFEISTCSQVLNIWFQLIYNFIQMDWPRDSIHVKLVGEPFLLTQSYERLNLNCRMPDQGLEMPRLCVYDTYSAVLTPTYDHTYRYGTIEILEASREFEMIKSYSTIRKIHKFLWHSLSCNRGVWRKIYWEMKISDSQILARGSSMFGSVCNTDFNLIQMAVRNLCTLLLVTCMYVCIYINQLAITRYPGRAEPIWMSSVLMEYLPNNVAQYIL